MQQQQLGLKCPGGVSATRKASSEQEEKSTGTRIFVKSDSAMEPSK
jgi:hypothetical protein